MKVDKLISIIMMLCNQINILKEKRVMKEYYQDKN